MAEAKIAIKYSKSILEDAISEAIIRVENKQAEDVVEITDVVAVVVEDAVESVVAVSGENSERRTESQEEAKAPGEQNEISSKKTTFYN